MYLDKINGPEDVKKLKIDKQDKELINTMLIAAKLI